MAIFTIFSDKVVKLKQTFGNLNKDIWNSYFRKYLNYFEVYQRAREIRLLSFLLLKHCSCDGFTLLGRKASFLEELLLTSNLFIGFETFWVRFLLLDPILECSRVCCFSFDAFRVIMEANYSGQVESRWKSNHLNVCFGMIGRFFISHGKLCCCTLRLPLLLPRSLNYVPRRFKIDWCEGVGWGSNHRLTGSSSCWCFC